MTPAPRPRRVAIVTGGGDAPGVNAVLRGFVHHAVRHGVEVLGVRDGFEGLLAAATFVPLTISSVRGILPRGGSILGCSTRVNPFFYLPKGAKEPRDLGPEIVQRLGAMECEAMALVGGDGTMVAAQRFMALGLPCVGIPKTIDNDLGGTDATVGFDSAVDTATHAIDALHATAEAHQRVMIVEVMGRYAGWIALRSGLAGGGDVVLIPEIAYDVDRIVAKVREREALGLRFTIVVIAEGAAAKGEATSEVEPGKPGILPRLGGAGDRLVKELAARDLGHEIRLTVLGHLQRGGSPSALDRTLGTRMGVHGAELCEQRRFGRMVSLHGMHVGSMPIDEALAAPRRVDPSGELAQAARAVGIELGG